MDENECKPIIDIESFKDSSDSKVPDLISRKVTNAQNIFSFKKSAVKISQINDHVSITKDNSSENAFFKRSLTQLGFVTKLPSMPAFNNIENPENKMEEIVINPILAPDGIETYIKQRDYMNVLSEPIIKDELLKNGEEIESEEIFWEISKL